MTLLFAFSPGNAQKIKSYKARITLTDNCKVSGVLYSASKEGLALMDKNLIGTASGLAIGAGFGTLEDQSSLYMKG